MVYRICYVCASKHEIGFISSYDVVGLKGFMKKVNIWIIKQEVFL